MVRIDNLTFRYADTEEEIFSSLSLNIEAGEICLLMGEAGEGKTTLARLLTGGVPKYNDGEISGSIHVDGISLLDLDIADRIRLIGRVAQNTDEMILFSTVEAELSFPLENLGFDKKAIDERVSYILGLFELEKYREVSTTELSGGEKRRLMCAILFAVNPSVYILDESFDELSPRWRLKLKELLRKSGKTVLVLGSHDLACYEGLFDKRLSLERGKVVEYIDKEAKPFSYIANAVRKDVDSLEIRDIKLFRHHKSIAEKQPFELCIDSFSLYKGDIHILMGDNGAGKSTFSRVLCGLLKQDSGDILINGRKTDERERRVKVAYLMQNPFEQLFLPTVLEELKSTGASDKEIEKALGVFHLNPEWYISEISYGRAKLVQAAIFYLLDRDYAIFDELDSAMSYEETFLVLKAYIENGVGILAITHDERFATLLGAERSYIKAGRLCR